ncbi:MAG: succinate dehydrogenase assembly factor 2 [Hyphomicrobiales bacterium]|nr:MAG: succinate dehydrogenase assembly factor 2 [Hyphomicrobiales bacterium]
MTGYENMDPRRKKLRLRSWRRGMKEMDLIMGTFADDNIGQLTEAELDEFEALGNEPDQKVYSWITGAEDVPEKYDTDLFARIRATRPRRK